MKELFEKIKNSGVIDKIKTVLLNAFIKGAKVFGYVAISGILGIITAAIAGLPVETVAIIAPVFNIIIAAVQKAISTWKESLWK